MENSKNERIEMADINELVEFVQEKLSNPVFDGNIVCCINEPAWAYLRYALKFEEIHIVRKTYHELVFNRDRKLTFAFRLDQRHLHGLTSKDYVVYWTNPHWSPYEMSKRSELIRQVLLPRNVTVIDLI